MNFDKLTRMLYQENINWVYSIIRDLDTKGIERKEKFIADPYVFNNIVALGYYFMNLYVVSNLNNYTEDDANLIMNSIITGASSYNQYKLNQIYKRDINLDTLVEQYNSVVRKTKAYSPNDGLKARVVAVDEMYRRIYDVFNKRHFNVFIKVFITSFKDFENSIQETINSYLIQR
ncbi:MAG: hypothetical protein J1F35_05445 [Erysipelotrichales bacterium]|nr:hypothetical protein [Erysipelotrichales bacterium]